MSEYRVSTKLRRYCPNTTHNYIWSHRSRGAEDVQYKLSHQERRSTISNGNTKLDEESRAEVNVERLILIDSKTRPRAMMTQPIITTVRPPR